MRLLLTPRFPTSAARSQAAYPARRLLPVPSGLRGRQDRRHEPFLTSIGAMADRVADLLRDKTDRPLALFGHSMGAMVAYETARRLERAGVPVAGLFVSGRRAPSRVRDESVHTRTD